MENPYIAPAAELESRHQLPRKKTGWKIFFWIFLSLVCLSFWFVISDAESSIIDKVGEVIVYTLMTLGLFGFAYNTKIFTMLFWRYFIPFAMVWDIYTLVSEDWSIFSEIDIVTYILICSTLAAVGVWLFFQYFALYQYAYQSREIWAKKSSTTR